MNRFTVGLVVLGFYCLYISCGARVSQHDNKHAGMKLAAWNEDTVHTIMIHFDDPNRFYYTFIDHSLPEIKRHTFGGTWTRTGDTILLQYKENRKPEDFDSFLTIESTDHYLIQQTDSNKGQIYFRIAEYSDPHGYHPKRPWDKLAKSQ